VRPIGPARKDFGAATLRSRYAELLRLRGYVQRLERLYQDQEEVHTRGWLAAINEQYGAED
jgi:hypothetical protein